MLREQKQVSLNFIHDTLLTHIISQLYESVASSLADSDRDAATKNFHLLSSRLVDANRTYQVGSSRYKTLLFFVFAILSPFILFTDKNMVYDVEHPQGRQ